MRLELQTFQTLIRGSAQTTHLQMCFSEQLLGSFVACQSKIHSDTCHCGEPGLLAEVKTRGLLHKMFPGEKLWLA